MTKLPKKIKIGNLIYKIREITDGTEEYFGKSSYAEQEIALTPELKGDKLMEVFLHSIIHPILIQGEYHEENRDEKLITLLANNLYQVLKDNKFIN